MSYSSLERTIDSWTESVKSFIALRKMSFEESRASFSFQIESKRTLHDEFISFLIFLRVEKQKQKSCRCASSLNEIIVAQETLKINEIKIFLRPFFWLKNDKCLRLFVFFSAFSSLSPRWDNPNEICVLKYRFVPSAGMNCDVRQSKQSHRGGFSTLMQNDKESGINKILIIPLELWNWTIFLLDEIKIILWLIHLEEIWHWGVPRNDLSFLINDATMMLNEKWNRCVCLNL